MASFGMELVLAGDLKAYSQAALSFHFIFLLRRVLFVVAVFSLHNWGCLQIYVILFTSLFSAMYVSWIRPYKDN